MRVRFRIGTACVLAAAALCVFAASAPAAELKGECVDVYGGQVCTNARMKNGKVTLVGATIPIASIENSPAEAEEAWPPVALAKPKLPAAATKASGFTELTMYWEPHGHPPGPYLTPHFDFHFYFVPADEVAKIDCSDPSKPAELPEGYSLVDVPLPPEMAKMMGTSKLVGICVPQMGMHAVPTAELEAGKLFTGDIIVGYYQDKPLFVEPMLSKELLMQKKSFEYAIPQIPGYKGTMPTRFIAKWDEGQQAYHFVLSGFTM